MSSVAIKAGPDALGEVTGAMDVSELRSLLETQFKARIEPDLPHAVLADHVRTQFASAASYSLPWSRAVDYPGAVAVVAKRLKIPAPADSPIEEIERVVLFKMIEKSLSGMSEAQKLQLAEQIEAELRTRGIYRRVAFHEIVDFVKFAGMDVGGTVGGLVLAGPGLSGLVGLNFLQWVVLKAILITSGKLAAAGAVLGIGAGGALMAAAGAAGPIGAAVAVLYTGYAVSGPAFRKLIPAVCVIAAKRIELAAQMSASAVQAARTGHLNSGECGAGLRWEKTRS